MATHVTLRRGQEHIALEVHREGDRYRVVIDGKEHLVEVRYLDDASLSLVVDGHRYRVELDRNERERAIAVGGEAYRFTPERGGPAHSVVAVAPPEITAPMPGKILEVLVSPGDRVEAGSGLIVMEAMKMETRLAAEAAASVAEVRVGVGDMVDGGQVLVVLSYDVSK